MIQIIAVIGIFLISAYFIARKIYRGFFSSEHDCEGCAVSQLHQKKNH